MALEGCAWEKDSFLVVASSLGEEFSENSITLSYYLLS